MISPFFIRWLLITVMMFPFISSIADTILALSKAHLKVGWRISYHDTINKLYPGGVYIIHPKHGEFLLPKSEIKKAADNTIELPNLLDLLDFFCADISNLSVADTSKWHPKTIYFLLPDRKLTFKLPQENEQDPSGVANLLFQCKESGKIQLHDTIKGGYRSFNTQLLSGGKYDAILLYNSGKYIKYSNIVFEKKTDVLADMSKLETQPPDSASRHWLTLRAFDTPIWERVYHKYYSKVSEKKIRGYIYNDRGFQLCLGTVIVTDDFKKWAYPYHDGYFEFDVDPNQTINISNLGFYTREIKITENCGLIVWMEGVPIDPNINITTGQH